MDEWFDALTTFQGTTPTAASPAATAAAGCVCRNSLWTPGWDSQALWDTTGPCKTLWAL